MELVLGTHHLVTFGGGETYLLTVAEQLQRLGHEVTLYALEQGDMAQRGRDRGMRVAAGEQELPARCDAALVQASSVSHALAARDPDTPQAFVCHSEVFSIDTPPQLAGAVSTVVALSDRVARHLRAMACQRPLVRLRQPVDVWRFTPSGPPRAQARRVAVISNYLEGPRRDVLLAACEQRGLTVEVFGRGSAFTESPELVMSRADIVVGKGRVVLEAMACGRAAYVYDWTGADGWVTPERYPELEADAFAGLAQDTPVEPERLAADLAAYDAGMGVANRDLVMAHHSAQSHAEQLIELLRGLASAHDGAREPLRELAWLAREQWRAEATTMAMRAEMARQQEVIDALERQAKDALDALSAFKRTRRYRTAEAMSRPLDALRGRRG